jgi:hypothetical protein
MEPYNAIEERVGDGGGCIGLHQGDEVRILGEVIHHREDD